MPLSLLFNVFCSYKEMVSWKRMNRLRKQISLFSSLPLYRPPKYIQYLAYLAADLSVVAEVKFTCQLLYFCLINVYAFIIVDQYALCRVSLVISVNNHYKMNWRSNNTSSFIDPYFFFPLHRVDDVFLKVHQSLC